VPRFKFSTLVCQDHNFIFLSAAPRPWFQGFKDATTTTTTTTTTTAAAAAATATTIIIISD